jgi:hypothetical protein
MIEDALATGELRLGREHPSLVPLMVDLATIARRLGNLTEARNQLRRAYAVVAAVGGADHPTALSIEGRIAAVGYRLGENTEVYDRHLADVGVRVLGPEHPAIRGALQRLGQTPQPGPSPAPTPVPVIMPEPPDMDGTLLDAPMSPSSESRPLPVPVRPSPYGPALEGDIVVTLVEDPTVRAPRRVNRNGLALVLSLSVVVLIAGAVVALQLLSPGGGPSAPDPVSGQSPTRTVAIRSAPTGVLLTDKGGSVTLAWTDPSDGTVTFVIAGGLRDTELAELASVPAGRNSATVFGTDPNADYCFTVAAVWPGDVVRTARPVCTTRTTPSPSTG